MQKSFRKSIKRAAAAAALALSFALFPKAGYALDPIMPLAEVQEGMQGTAYTVVDSSREIKTFGVDVIHPILRGKGENPLIMARAYGSVVEAAGGILQGMSGSPVYVNGRLIGAVALGYKDMTPYTFFITPIEEMTKLWDMPDLKNKTRLKSINLKAHSADGEKKPEAAKLTLGKASSIEDQLAGKKAADEAETKKPKDKEKKKDLLYVSGFTPAGTNFLEKHLQAKGFSCLPVDIGGAASGAVAKDHAVLYPGSSVGVAVAYGDFSISGVGTVTATQGKKVVAFGHSFLHRGNVNFFMTDADVYGTISGVSSGMKIAGIGSVIGRINQDRETGIAGILGEYPSAVPIRVHVHDATLGRDDTYTSTIAYDEDLLPTLAATIAYGAIGKTSDTVSAATADVKFTIRTNATAGGSFERQNMFFGTTDVGQNAVNELLAAVGIICTNKERESDILDIKVDINMENGRKTASIVSAIPEKTHVAPGETVMIKTTIKPYRRPEETVNIPYKVAGTQPAGPLSLDVRGGGYVPSSSPLLALTQVGGDTSMSEVPEASTEDQLKTLKESDRNNVITVAPGAPLKPLSKSEKRRMARAAAEAAAEAAKHKAQLLSGEEAAHPGEVKYATNYIVDNVVHTALVVEKNK